MATFEGDPYGRAGAGARTLDMATLAVRFRKYLYRMLGRMLNHMAIFEGDRLSLKVAE